MLPVQVEQIGPVELADLDGPSAAMAAATGSGIPSSRQRRASRHPDKLNVLYAGFRGRVDEERPFFARGHLLRLKDLTSHVERELVGLGGWPIAVVAGEEEILPGPREPPIAMVIKSAWGPIGLSFGTEVFDVSTF
jgi:hypothetical protein